MNENSFQIGEREFKLHKIDALKQFHIVRRIAPILGEILPALKAGQGLAESFDTLSNDKKFELIANFAKPVMTGFSKLLG